MLQNLSWSHFCSYEKLFSKFPHKSFFIILCDIIGLEHFLLCFSQSELSNFSCILLLLLLVLLLLVVLLLLFIIIIIIIIIITFIVNILSWLVNEAHICTGICYFDYFMTKKYIYWSLNFIQIFMVWHTVNTGSSCCIHGHLESSFAVCNSESLLYRVWWKRPDMYFWL